MALANSTGRQVFPESSESREDPSLRRERAFQEQSTTTSPAPEEGQKPEELPASNVTGLEKDGTDPAKKKESKDKPKRATGVHPAIRTTSTEDIEILAPAPNHDDPYEDTPGEADNPYHEASDDDFDVSEDV
jgi:hypothetical protein